MQELGISILVIRATCPPQMRVRRRRKNDIKVKENCKTKSTNRYFVRIPFIRWVVVSTKSMMSSPLTGAAKKKLEKGGESQRLG